MFAALGDFSPNRFFACICRLIAERILKATLGVLTVILRKYPRRLLVCSMLIMLIHVLLLNTWQVFKTRGSLPSHPRSLAFLLGRHLRRWQRSASLRRYNLQRNT